MNSIQLFLAFAFCVVSFFGLAQPVANAAELQDFGRQVEKHSALTHKTEASCQSAKSAENFCSNYAGKNRIQDLLLTDSVIRSHSDTVASILAGPQTEREGQESAR